MATMAQVIDGQLQQTAVGQSSASDKKAKGDGLDKEAFLQLLVAQMKYQDPLEPTSNTEYVSQLATFSELEEMQNLVANSDRQRANELVGQTVTMKVSSDNGSERVEEGIVDYVKYEGSKTLLGINGENYNLDDLIAVSDAEYVEAYSMATAVVTALGKLPLAANMGLESKEAVDSITKIYDSMNEYQRSFLGKSEKDAIEAYRAKIDELVKLAELRQKALAENEDGSKEETDEDSIAQDV